MTTVIVNDAAVSAADCAAHLSLLGYLREAHGLTGTKEGCASGDCGACTVIVRDVDGSNPQNINSCITPVGAAIGKQVLTVEGVGTPQALHPVQEEMVAQHGSQCGFCTPGFVMSMVAAQLKTPTEQLGDPDERHLRDEAITAVSGNLCRCTGYRPIIAAALSANERVANGEKVILATPAQSNKPDSAATSSYLRPTGLAEALTQLRTQGMTRTLVGNSNVPWLLAGATDGFLEVSQRYLDPTTIVDISAVEELQGIKVSATEISIGAATTHEQALEFFAQSAGDSPADAALRSPAIVDVLKRFGSPQIRGRGTLGGNIANASPIADWPPLLIALNAELTLVNTAGERRREPIDAFYLDYKRTTLAADELVQSIHIPRTMAPASLRAHKISKRFEDDISSTLGAIYLTQEDGLINECRIAFGGVAAIPLRCVNTEAVLLGKALSGSLIEEAAALLREEISPITDVRASADYRRAASIAVLRNALAEHLTSGAST